jgi:transcriptional regulator with XRE-family HTH domain
MLIKISDRRSIFTTIMARHWIRQLRLSSGLSQAQLAQKAQVASNRLSRIESGYCEMTETEVKTLAEVLRVPASTIRGAAATSDFTPELAGPVPAEPVVPQIRSEPVTLVLSPTQSSQPTQLPPAISAVDQPPQPPPPPKPAIVYSLSDPAHYRQTPDLSLLERGDLPPPRHAETMRAALRAAEAVLHTSRVPADIWRQWREFEKQLRVRLRALAAS